ncbi:hypothetical protein [Kosakonia oryzendophytica]|uniref:glycine-rich domain-containing protein n=1 Tax=Kosakonia TaxID=1330547 RepID=UPI00077762DA|nr:hypothetical protein [Kosakonia oryzendophytica]AMO47401.1 Hypothetical protein AKI40_0978 [Enterobacter sp. FY-07]TDT56981.1 hypothetical protein DFO53_3004 [Enterobacter sp. AG5470]WBT59126.1 hypothetical protein O9K67_04830 [Kosakonia oryzendophytica]
MLQQALRSNINNGPLNVSDIDRVLAYQNEDLITKFRKEWNVTQEEAEDIFYETKKFLYLAARCQTECFNISVYEQMQVIDEMWHTFVLFTDRYHHFCEEYLGGFLHHFPFTREMLRSEIKHITAMNSDFETYKQQAYHNQILKIKELLGEETVIKWYGEYAVNYSIDRLNALRMPLVSSEVSSKSFNMITSEILAMPKDEVMKIIMGSLTGKAGCGCSGKGCGAGCSCNSR